MNTKKVNQVSVLLGETIELLQTSKREDLAQDVLNAKNRLTQRERVVLVSGEFKRGKSSLINALLEQDGLCPVDIDIATSVVSLIRYGQQGKVIRHYGNVGGDATEEVPFDQLTGFATGAEADDTWFLEIEIPCDTLKDGLIFIDTPGVGGLDPRHAFLTSYFLPKADVSLFVVDAGEPLSDAELSFLRDKVAGKARELIIVLNKADNAESIETSVADVQEKVKKVLGEAVPVVPVSSRLKLDYLKDGDDADFIESNFEMLEQQIVEAIAGHAGTLCRLAVQEASTALQSALAPLIMQSEQFKDASKDDLQEMRQRCLERKKEVEAFCGPTSEWRVRLNTEIQDLKMQVGFKLKDASIDFTRTKLPELVKEMINLDSETVVQRMESEFRSICSSVEDLIQSKTASVCEDVGGEFYSGEIVLNSSNPFSASFKTQIDNPKKDVKNIIKGSVKGGFFGFVLWNSIPVVGPLAGLFFLAEGVKDAMEAEGMHREKKLQSALAGGVEKALLAMQQYFDGLVKQAGEVMQKAVQTEATRIQSRYTEVADALDAMTKQTAEERKKHERLVKTKIAPIEQMLKYYERLEKSLTGDRV